MKTINITKILNNKIIFSLLNFILLIFLLTTTSCSGDDQSCGYQNSEISSNCDLKSKLNLSTGIDSDDNPILPGSNVVDPFWRLLNNPPLVNCNNDLANTINGSAYLINYQNLDQNSWVNQPNSTTLAPVDLGTTNGFSCRNVNNTAGNVVPYVFERPFCILEDTCVDFDFTFKGDDSIYFELINNATNTIVPNVSIGTSVIYAYPTTVKRWAADNVCLNSGNYSIRGYLTNLGTTVLGFSLVGNLTTTNSELSLSNNVEGCCENNTISILNVREVNVCNRTFDGGDELGDGWVFNLRDSSGVIIRTGTTDINGNLFFAGLPDGDYKVEIVPQTGYTPNQSSVTISLSNNIVEMIEFYNCQ